MKTITTMSRWAATAFVLSVQGIASIRAAADTVWFAERQVHVRTAPSASGEVKFTLGINTRTVRDRIDGDWSHIIRPVGGWVMSDALSPYINFNAGGIGGRYARRLVNLRADPSVGGPVRATFGVNSAIHFDGVAWKDEGDHWAHVTYPLSGWMQTDALGRDPLWTTSHVGGRYVKSAANLRSGPGTNFPVRRQLRQDGHVEVDAWIQDRGGWSHLKSPFNGWVTSALLTTTRPDPLGPSFWGTAYRYGRAYAIELVRIDGKAVAKKSAGPFLQMRESARRAGVSIYVVSGFRTMAEQQALWARYGSPRAARPGYSNHQSGTAFDLNTSGFGGSVYNWLTGNAGRYGFQRTVSFEPWHWEYMR